MTSSEENIRKRLNARREELMQLADITAADASPVALDQQSVGRLSRMDAMQRQAMSQEQERRRAREILRIDRALQRLEEGEYGVCQECGEDISQKRLSVDPAAHLCITCARMSES